MDWRGTALVAAFCILPVIDGFGLPLRTLDEILLLVHPEQVLAGRMPHSDFFTVYGPGGYGLLAVVYAMSGPEIVGERGVGLAYHLALALGILQFTRPLGRRPSRVAGVTSALVLAPLGLVAYAWLGGLALAVWSLALLVRSGGPRSVFAAGVLSGLVPAWRIEMLVLVAATAPLVWRTRVTTPLLTGLAVGLFPTLIFLAASGSDTVNNVIVSRMAVNAQLALQDVHVLVWTAIAVSLVTAAYLLWLVGRRSPLKRLAASSFVLTVLVLPQMVQRIDVTHVLFGLCVVGPLGLAFVLSHATTPKPGPRPHAMGLPGLLTAALLVLLTVSAAISLQNPLVTQVSNGNRSVLVATSGAEELTQLIRAIKESVPAGSNIFVGAKDMSVPTLSRMELYHLLPEYESQAYYLDLPPGVAEQAGSRLLDDVLQADALILTEIPRSLTNALFPNMGSGVETVNRAVESTFCPRRTVSSTTIYLRCDHNSQQAELPAQSVGTLRSNT